MSGKYLLQDLRSWWEDGGVLGGIAPQNTPNFPLNRVFPILLSVMLMGLMISACNGHTERPPEPQELISEGKTVYLEYCAECHQTDGEGYSTLYPRLAGNPIVTLHDPEPIIDTVLYGQASMMSFRDKLDNKQIAAVLSYIRNSWGNKAPAVSPRQIH